MKIKNDMKKRRLLPHLAAAGRQVIRFIFSRYFITLAIILVELFLIEHMLYVIAENLLITTAVVFVLYAIGFVHLINRDTSPEYKLTWLVVIAIPIAGVILYFLFFERRLSRREAELISRYTDSELLSKEPSLDIPAESPHYGKVRALLRDDPMALAYSNTGARFFSSGEEYFSSLIDDLRNAERFIFLEYFIIDEGALWSRIRDVLSEKAALGVDVRVIYDDIGCMQTLPSRYEKVLAEDGISAFRFGKVTPRVSSVHNNRDHRKIAVIDGKIGYTGGVNIADEYANIKEKYGHWKDGGIRIEGDGARGLLRLFLATYDFVARENSDYFSFLYGDDNSHLADGGIYIPFGSGPAPVYGEKSGKNLLLNIINQARRYVYITTPYLIIDHELTEALCKAARRGVLVRIITPGIADKKIVKIMTKSSYPYLMKSGVEIYEYTSGFIHEKTIISDGEYLVVGTVNLDYRSLIHHFEDGVFIVNSPVVGEAERCYFNTLEKSDLRDKNEARLTFIEWIVRNIIKIFAPLF